MSEDGKTCILMVCRGNICRSPIAEGVLVDLVKKRGLEQKYLVDSCATGMHPYSRTVCTHKRTILQRHVLVRQTNFSLSQRLLPATGGLNKIWGTSTVRSAVRGFKTSTVCGTE